MISLILKERSPSTKNKLTSRTRRDLLMRKMCRWVKVKANKSNTKVRIINEENDLTNWTKILNHSYSGIEVIPNSSNTQVISSISSTHRTSSNSLKDPTGQTPWQDLKNPSCKCKHLTDSNRRKAETRLMKLVFNRINREFNSLQISRRSSKMWIKVICLAWAKMKWSRWGRSGWRGLDLLIRNRLNSCTCIEYNNSSNSSQPSYLTTINLPKLKYTNSSLQTRAGNQTKRLE